MVTLLALLLPGSGCTIIGTAISPITGPVDAVASAIESKIPVLDALWTVPWLMLGSPFAGLMAGMGVDVDYLTTGKLRVEKIMRPWSNLPGH